ncbi:MAG: hypothetical protein WCL50_06030, partial [Spirochaetota bacterium]
MRAKSGYAAVLEWGTRLGLLLAFVTLAMDLGQLLPSMVGMDEMDRYWSLPLADYIAATRCPTGPGAWLGFLGTQEGLFSLPAILFSLLPLPAYLMIAIPAVREGNHVYAVMIVVEMG